jgi:dTDP-4-dehydrorhamnose reductase/UDP-glucose 4-epimerase
MAESKGRLLLVGKNSFIATHLLAALPKDRVVAKSHGDLEAADLLDGVEVALNCSRHPKSSGDDYDLEALDPDLALARRLADRDIPMIMLSSRKVYAPSDAPLGEEAALGPSDAYGRNKLKAEKRLRELLGRRLTILRLANIFGDERVAGRRSFLAMTLGRLAEQQQIHYDMSPFVERDFLPVDILADLLARIVRDPPGGVMNIGSGIALPTGRIALWIMEGYGGGELLIGSHQEKDRFVLDITRQKDRYGRPCTADDLRRRCIDLGRNLRDSRAG